ncbi:MAG TPA: hypothetical protein VEW42_04310 [Candidatus Eisenbacteria bacterium]|nr:hypothetical protein [Candidatus Eisenbacteria bacterium]
MPASAQYFCYVESNRLSLFGNNGVTLAVPIAPDVMSDLEVVSREKLIAYIGQFLQANAVPAGVITFLLAPEGLFEQDLSAVAPKDVDVFAQKFLDSIPFETVASKRITVGGKLRLVASNKDVIDGLKKAFEKKGFTPVAYVPYTVIQATVPELANALDQNVIFGKLDSFKQYSLVEDIIRPTTFEKKTGLKGRRDMMLLAVFGVLMIILVVMVLVNFVFTKPKTVVPEVGPLPTRVLVFPTSTATPSGK